MTFKLNQQNLDNLDKNPQQLIALIANLAECSPEEIKIQAGRRTLYGQMARGEFRSAIDSNHVNQILEGLASAEVGKEINSHKIPEFQISAGNRLLFRQERDGTISTNKIQIELEDEINQKFTWRDAFSEAYDPIVEQPQQQPEYDESQLVATAKALNFEYEKELAATTPTEEEVVNYIVNSIERDFKPELASATTLEKSSQEQSIELTDRQAQTPSTIPLEKIFFFPANPQVALNNGNAFDFVKQQLQQWTPSQPQTKDFTNKIVDTAQQQYLQTREEINIIARSVRSLWQQGQSLAGQVRSAYKSEDVQQKIQQSKDKVSYGVVAFGNWLASRPEAIARSKLMEESYQKFQQGHDRTLESQYQVGNFTINKQGQNFFELKQGNTLLMQYKVEKNLFGRETFHLKGIKANSSSADLLKQLRNSTQYVVGSPEAEAKRNDKLRSLLPMLERLEEKVQFNGYQIERGAIGYELKSDRGKTIDFSQMTNSQILQLEKALNIQSGQQQSDRIMPILAKHLHLMGIDREETNNSLISFDRTTNTLNYQNKDNLDEFISARYLGEQKWRYQNGQLSPEKELQLTQLASQQELYEQQLSIYQKELTEQKQQKEQVEL
jgi:hypothetical protein